MQPLKEIAGASEGPRKRVRSWQHARPIGSHVERRSNANAASASDRNHRNDFLEPARALRSNRRDLVAATIIETIAICQRPVEPIGFWCKQRLIADHVRMRWFVSVEALFSGRHFDR